MNQSSFDNRQQFPGFPGGQFTESPDASPDGQFPGQDGQFFGGPGGQFPGQGGQFPGGPGGQFPGQSGQFPGGPGGPFPGQGGQFPGGPGGPFPGQGGQFPGGPGGPFPGQGGQFPGGPGGPFPGQGGQFPGGGPSAVAPTSPPPDFEPTQSQFQTFAVDPGAIRGCLYRFTYIWLRRDSFWFFPVFVGRRSISGFRWYRNRWVYYGVDLDRVQSFQCF
ncbi:hypothetical protein ACFQ3N_05200 [Virgibacillus byunsanensis]|uniref:Transporter n=1 Tax=Virgibacillus byunsanensis TaxID=570945 RepID=A0ABW3LIL8_9BACI